MYYGQTISPTGRSGAHTEALPMHASFMPKGLVNAGAVMHRRVDGARCTPHRILPLLSGDEGVDGPRDPHRTASSHDRHNPRRASERARS